MGHSLSDDAVANLVTRAEIIETIGRLKSELRALTEPFVWATIALHTVADVPAVTRSDRPGYLRCGPSVGRGNTTTPIAFSTWSLSRVTAVREFCSTIGEVVALGDGSLGDAWVVIAPGVPHEFYPEKDDMIVMSFHTAHTAEEPLEVSESGASIRHYE